MFPVPGRELLQIDKIALQMTNAHSLTWTTKMAITFSCSCGKRLQIDEKHAGKKVRCPECKLIATSPAPQPNAVEVLRPVKPPPLPVVQVLDEALSDPLSYEEVEPDDLDEEPRARKKPKPRVPSADDIPNHNGEVLPEDAVFFAPPPREIGRVLSGYTTVREGQRPMSTGVRVAWVVGSTAVTLLMGLSLMFIDRAFVLLSPVFALAGFLISFLATRFAHNCTYVGVDGIVRLTCKGSFKNLREEMFLFEDADELRTKQTRHYVNGIYSGTQYEFNWTDPDRRHVFKLRGGHRSEQGTPHARDPYHYAVAAELAWSEHLLDRFRTKLEDGGSIKFALRGSDWIRIGPGLVVLNRRGDKIDFEGEDIARVRIDQGVVAILEPGAKEGWFSSKGVYKFNYQDLANAQFFLFLMDRLLGVRAG